MAGSRVTSRKENQAEWGAAEVEQSVNMLLDSPSSLRVVTIQGYSATR